MLELRDVSRRFGGLHAVSNLTLTVPAGRITGLIGPNGAGKTTVFNLITGALPPSAGSIRFDGIELVGRRPHGIVRLGIARTFQTVRLFRTMTVWEHVLVAQNHRATRGAGWLLGAPGDRPLLREAREALELMGLWSAREHAAVALSYGNQRRLEIARALASRPRLLLLDEPSAGMNPAESEVLLRTLEKIRSRGIALVLIEHAMSLVMDLCDRVAVLNFGQKIAEGTPAEVQANPLVLEATWGGTREEGGGTMLAVSDLRSGYGRLEVVRGVSLEVREGEIVTLIGANGAGKTTLLKTVSGVLPARAGRIAYDGEWIERLTPPQRVRRGLVLVPEGRGILQRMTVRENLLMGAYARPRTAPARRKSPR